MTEKLISHIWEMVGDQLMISENCIISKKKKKSNIHPLFANQIALNLTNELIVEVSLWKSIQAEDKRNDKVGISSL